MSTGQSPQKRPGNGAPIPPGAVDLRAPRIKEILVTHHETTFQGTQTQISAVTDADNKVLGYVFIIHDLKEQHKYTLAFDQASRDSFRELLGQLPDIGQKVPDGQ